MAIVLVVTMRIVLLEQSQAKHLTLILQQACAKTVFAVMAITNPTLI